MSAKKKPLASPTPWMWRPSRCITEDGDKMDAICDADRNTVCFMERRFRADAKLIVRAVNFYVRRRVLIGVRKAQRGSRT